MNKIITSLVLVFLLVIKLFPEAGQKSVALTFDDLPTNGLGMLTEKEQADYFRRILSVLDKYNIRVMGFANSRKFKPGNMFLLDQFMKKGHTLGNHTYSHPDLNRIAISDFIADINRGETGIKQYMGKTKYFRYPMLHRGDTPKKKKVVYNYLITAGYRVVPVSIDNNDFLYNRDYIRASKSGKRESAEKIAAEYLEHMAERSLYFDQLGLKKTGRHILHILLLHMNYINAYYLDKLIEWYRENGWQIIAPETALQDPVYTCKDVYIGKKGLSYLERLAEQ